MGRIMYAFVKSPIYNNWLKHNKPNESLLICSPFFKKSALEKITTCYGLNASVNHIEVDVLIRGKVEDFIKGSSDISALESLIQMKSIDIDRVRRLTNLHMKAYLIDGKRLLIGSGNFTQRGLFASMSSGNVEGAIATSDENAIKDFKLYFDDVSLSSQSLDSFYDEICEGYDRYIDAYHNSIEKEISNLKVDSELKSKYLFKVTKDSKTNIVVKNIVVEAIPQYSDFDDGCIGVVSVLTEKGNPGLTFVELGQALDKTAITKVAFLKYGENHAKLAELLDLVTITNTRPRKVYLTKLGTSFYNSSQLRRVEVLKAQIFRMDIIKDLIIKSSNPDFKLLNYLCLYLKRSTAERRSNNIRTLFRYLLNNGISEIQPILDSLYS